MTNRDNDEDYRDNRQQIELPRIVTTGARFPKFVCRRSTLL